MARQTLGRFDRLSTSEKRRMRVPKGQPRRVAEVASPRSQKNKQITAFDVRATPRQSGLCFGLLESNSAFFSRTSMSTVGAGQRSPKMRRLTSQIPTRVACRT